MIRRFIDSYFLDRYQDADFVIRQKARVLSVILITACFLILFLFSYHLFLERPMGVLIMRSFGLISCLFVLGMIRKGYFSIAGHVIMSAIFITVWSVMFIDENRLISTTDTIVLSICAFSSCALILDKRKWTIFVYWAINIALLVAFCFHIAELFQLPFSVALEYFLDNFIAFFFVASISYQVLAINNKALSKANESIKQAEEEALKNKNLSESLELKVNQRTKELVNNNNELQKEIRERKTAESKLREMQQKLVENAHKAGMAEIASDTFHNVGNVLNSIKTSAQLIDEYITERVDAKFSMACDLLKENRDNIKSFLTEDPKGVKLIEYLLILEEEFKETFGNIDKNTKRLKEKIETVAEVIIAQQNYAGSTSLTVSANLNDIIENALAMIPDLMSSMEINVVKNIQSAKPIKIQKTKLLHTMVNLFKNAAQAMNDTPVAARKLSIKAFEESNEVVVEVSDTGCGIARENLDKIFIHGYTTKEDGFGFGLHSCANYLQDMDASIEAKSGGPGLGSQFTIRFPLQ